MIKLKEDLPFLFNYHELTGSGVELGAFKGQFSKTILDFWEGEKLYIIDAWRHLKNYQDISNGDHNDHLANLAETFMTMYAYDERVVLIREMSAKAAVLFPDASLDFVFIDADYSYQAVRNDLSAWAPKVRPGGVLCGHGYVNSPYAENAISEYGVKKAVDEWANSVNAMINITTEYLPAWWTVR